MRYMDACACPYPILVADGGEDPEIERRLRIPSGFPRLRYDYLRYPVDVAVTDYYAKLADVVARVTTPYVMLADNDDFLLLDPAESCCDALDRDAGAVSCGGRRVVLRVQSSAKALLAAPSGPAYAARLDTRPKAVGGDTPAARLCYFLRHVQQHYLWSCWYAVHRTEALASALGFARRHTFRDPVTHELHVHLALLCRGGYAEDAAWSLVSQSGASQLTSQLEARGNILERFVAVNAFDDLHRILDELAPWLPGADRDAVTGALAAWLAAVAARAYPSPPRPTPWLHRWLRRSESTTDVRLPVLEPFILERAS